MSQSASLARAASTPNLKATEGEGPSTTPPEKPTTPPNKKPRAVQQLRAKVCAAEMVMSPATDELIVMYEISVHVGDQELAGARRRFREFHKLYHTLMDNYPHLLNCDGCGDSLVDESPPLPSRSSSAPMPRFPRKHLFRAGWDPVVVTERVKQLGEWLAAACDKLQFASLELVSFLNVPLYAAIRLLSGDLQVRARAREHMRTAPLAQLPARDAARSPVCSPGAPPLATSFFLVDAR